MTLCLLHADFASAQCSTADTSPADGVPDVCPAGSNYIGGTAGNDSLQGTNGDDCIFGLAGVDMIDGKKGDDYICGGDGDDDIDGKVGNDTVEGGDGNDKLRGGKGNDTVNGGLGDDDIKGGNDDDNLFGGDGDDDLQGGKGSDALSGGLGTDTLNGGAGTDSCIEEIPGETTRLTSCESITYASILGVELEKDADGHRLHWVTGSEIGVAGFEVQRRTRRGVWKTVGRVGVSPDGALGGAEYWVRDNGLKALGAVYRIVEQTATGGQISHGPYLLASTKVAGRIENTNIRRVADLPQVVRRAASPRIAKSVQQGPASGAIAWTEGKGLREISLAMLNASFGRAMNYATAFDELALFTDGQPVAWHLNVAGDGIRFYATPSMSPFSMRRPYIIREASGVTMIEQPGPTTLPSASPHLFQTTLRLEEDVFAGPAGASDPMADLTFWDYLTPTQTEAASLTKTVELVEAQAGTPVRIKLELQGATAHDEQVHRLEVLWNGVSAGVQEFLGRTAANLIFETTASTTLNTLEIRSTSAGQESSTVYLNAIEITYERVATESATSLEFTTSTASDVTGLSSESVQVYDISTPNTPLWLGASTLHPDDSNYGASFDTEAGRRLWVGTEAAVVPVHSLRSFIESTLRSAANSADYVIITHESLKQSAQSIAAHRESQGHRTKVIDIDNIFTEFGDGYPNPWAIRSFLSYAHSHWATPPKYVLLLGGGHMDYKGVSATGDNLLPPALASTDAGLLPSDTALADVVGNDSIPDMAIGRLPFWTDEQGERWLANTIAFESKVQEQSVVFASDRDDVTSFAAAAQKWSGAFNSPRTLALENEAPEDARERLLQWWDEGMSSLHYFGHGGLNRFGMGDLLTSEDLPMLAGMERRPLLAAWSCNLARFDIPGFDSIGVQMMQQGVTTSVLSSTGWFNHYDTEAMRDAFYESLSRRSVETLGDLKLQAHKAAPGADPQTHATWALLGDPGLRIAPPPIVLTAGTTTDEPRTSSSSGCSVGHSSAAPPWTALFFVALLATIRRRLPQHR